MIPAAPFGVSTLLFGLVVVALISMAILGIFKNDIYKRLSTRIIGLVFATSLVAMIVSSVLSEQIFNTQHPIRWRVIQAVLIVIGSPIVLGLLAARFVRRPLQQFKAAVASLEENNYKVQLQPTGISEFDEVFNKFNKLIKRLQHEEKLRKDLVSDTSHELNTPLTTMIGQLTALQEGKLKPTDERIATLKEQAERLAELVQQLDAYTKARMPDAGEPEDISLQQFCAQLIEQFSVALKQKHIMANVQIADTLTVYANRDVLQKILVNFIQNALRYSEATEVTISATPGQITFTDNGIGVPAESLAYLFERFYRVDKSRNRTTGGLGLGLAIVKELAEGQGWQVQAERKHPGLAFVLTLK